MKQKMLFLSGIIFLMVAFSATVVSAMTSNTYDLDTLGLSITFSDDYIVFIRDTPAKDSDYAALGLTKEYMDNMMESNSIYLNAIEKNIDHEIVITKASVSLEDFSLISDTTLSTLCSGLKSIYEKSDVTYIKSELYQHEQTKFIKIYFSKELNGAIDYGLQYYTVYDAHAINITIHSYDKIGSEKEKILKEIVDGVDFWNVKDLSEPAVSTGSFKYTDSETRAPFIAPSTVSATDNEYAATAIITLAAIIAIIAIMFGCHRRNVKKDTVVEEDRILREETMQNSLAEEETSIQQEQTKEAVFPDIESTDEERGAPQRVFCYKCGAELPVESVFCHKCGTKVYKEDIQ